MSRYAIRNKFKLECIPVGCVPPAAVEVKGGLHTPPLGADPHPPEQAAPWVWAWRPPRPDPPQLPPGLWAWRPPSGQIPLNFPLGCGPGEPPGQIPLNFPPGCGPENLQGMLGYHPPGDLLQGMLGYCKACWDITMHAGIAPPPPPPP